jgi:rubredoxin
MAKYRCTVCGYIYDEAKEGKKWEDLPEDWMCPACDSDKSYFNLLEEETPSAVKEKATSKLMICSVCGYIVKEGFAGELCPACGVSKNAFQPYQDRVSAKRRKILDLHMHNILVHFPQAFSLLMLFLIFLGFFLQGALKAELLITAKILSFFLPLAILASICSGLLDGKNRFKRLDTPILKKKILVAILFLIFAIGVLLIFTLLNHPSALQWLVFILTGLCALCSLFLGYNGGGLSRSEVPG